MRMREERQGAGDSPGIGSEWVGSSEREPRRVIAAALLTKNSPPAPPREARTGEPQSSSTLALCPSPAASWLTPCPFAAPARLSPQSSPFPGPKILAGAPNPPFSRRNGSPERLAGHFSGRAALRPWLAGHFRGRGHRGGSLAGHLSRGARSGPRSAGVAGRPKALRRRNGAPFFRPSDFAPSLAGHPTESQPPCRGCRPPDRRRSRSAGRPGRPRGTPEPLWRRPGRPPRPEDRSARPMVGFRQIPATLHTRWAPTHKYS